LFSSEVSFTQEMLLWEDNQPRRMDTRREPGHESDDDTPGADDEGDPAAEFEAAGLASPTRQGDR
jgi:hypothetical protein